MASTLKVNTIQHTGGTSALTIDSAGTIDFPVNTNITIFGLTTQTAITSTSLSTLTGWTKFNSQSVHGFKPYGSTINESSGYFTPVKLGLYKLELDLHIFRGSSPSARWFQADLEFTPNGGSVIAGDVYDNVPYSNSDTTYHLLHRHKYYNFNHANDKVRVRVAASNNVTIKASGASDFDSQLVFRWVAPPVA